MKHYPQGLPSSPAYLLRFSSFSFFHNLGLFVFVPFLSLILSGYGWGTSGISYFFAVFNLATFLFAPFIGRFADCVGRKKVILGGLAGQVLILLGYFFFLQYPGVSYVLRFIEGILFACVTAVSIGAFEQLVTERRGLWTGVFMSLSAYGKLFGPLLGGFIAQFFFRDAVLLMAVIFFLISLFFLFRLPDTRNPGESLHWRDLFPLIEIGHFLQSSRLGGVGLLGVLTNGKNTLFTMFFPILIVSQLGYSETTLGILLGLQGVMSSFQFLYGKIADKISEEFGVLLGCCIFSAGFIGFSLVDSIYGFGLLLLIIGIGSGIWNVSAWVLMGNQASKADDEAEIVGTYMSLAKLGMFLASVFGAVLVNAFGIALTLTYMGFSVLLGVCVVYFLFMPVFHKA